MDSGLGVWVRARSEADARTHQQERERVAAQANPPRLSTRQNVAFWIAFAVIAVVGVALGG